MWGMEVEGQPWYRLKKKQEMIITIRMNSTLRMDMRGKVIMENLKRLSQRLWEKM